MVMLTRESGRQIYFEHYAGRGPTVVLSHGWGMGCRAWDDTIARLTDRGHAVVAYDHRGCGRSDKDFADVSIDALGSDVVALCTHLGLAAVVLNGWSLGGAVVVDAAAKLGAKLRGLVLTVGATPRYTQAEGFPHGGRAEDVAGTVAALRAGRIAFLKGLYFGGVFAVDVGEDVKQRCWQIALEASPGADASLGALAQLDQRALLPKITAPALVVVGARDGVVSPDIGRAAAKALPNGRLCELDCGHAPFLELPDAYHAALFELLGRAQ
ncbi:MAG: alpha/beta hydrolase [Deltaproteobacteria bacterium]|nr:alpha/beta hydrolase [Deltaproteobacteria bacterium]